jgi:hypothetical protein
LLVYCAAIATGERIDVALLRTDWQVLPLGPLRAHPFGAVWHLHIQPPLWNLFIGAAGRWSPLGLTGSFYVLMAASGVVVAWGLAGLAVDLGLTSRGAVAIALVGSLCSPVLMNGFVARYELPVTALLVLLVREVRRDRAAVSVPLLVGAIVMLRTLYHPAWFVVVVAVWWFLRRGVLPWRRVLVAVAIVVAVIGGWMVKNEVQVGHLTLSTWSGMNLLRSVQPAVDPGTLASLHAQGRITDVAVATPFSTFDAYAQQFSCTPDSTEAVLTMPDRGTALQPFLGPRPVTIPNFNYACFVPVFSQAGRDAFAIIRADPRAWVKARAWSLNNWFGTPTIHHLARSPVTDTVDAIERVVLLVVPHPPLPSSWRANAVWVSSDPWSVALVIGTLLVIAAPFRRRWRNASPEHSGTRCEVVVSALIVLWTALAGILGELQEQVRFRSMTDPLVIVVGASVVVAWWRSSTRVMSMRAPSRSVVVSASLTALLVGGVGLASREGRVAGAITTRPTDTLPAVESTSPPATSFSAGTSAPAPDRPSCRHIVHLGDSNLALARQFFVDRYAALGIEATIDAANGRGASNSADGGTTALQAIALYRRTVPAAGRCWVIGLSDSDAMAARRDHTDPSVPITAMADALGNEPVVWVTPVLASATSEWNLAASTAYDEALLRVVSTRPSISVFDWQDVALNHLDQFAADGVHFLAGFYPFLADQVVSAMQRAWELGG